MQDRSGVKPDASRSGKACLDAASRDDLCDAFLGDEPEPVRSRCNIERRVVRTDRVEMQANGDHGFDEVDGRRDVQPPLLHRPRAITWNIDAFGDLYGAILVPAERPIGCVALVEQQRPDWPSRRPDHAADIGRDRSARIQSLSVGRRDPQTGPVGWHGVEQAFQLGERRSV